MANMGLEVKDNMVPHTMVRPPVNAYMILLVSIFFSVIGYAQPNRDGGSTGTLNHDYFYPYKDAHTLWLIKDVEKNHLEKALHYLRNDRLDDAIYDTRFLLDRFVNHPQGLVLISILSRLRQKPALAIYYYEKAIKLYPQHAITHLQYGSYLINVRHIDMGIERLKKAIGIDPNMAIAYAWLSRAYSENGNSELSRQAAEKARELGYTGTVFSQR